MGSILVVVHLPVFDQITSLTVAGEQLFVEALVPQTADEGLGKSVLHRLARRDVVPFDAAILLPFQHGVGGEFSPIVADHQARVAASFGDGVEFARDPLAGDRVVDDRGRTFSAEVVNDAQDAEATPVRQRVRDEVEAPTLVRPLRNGHRRPCSQGPFAAARLRTVNRSSR